MAPSRPSLLLARGILPRASSLSARALGRGGVAGLLVAGGRVLELAEGRAAVGRLRERSGARVRELGDVVLLPGLVNAHAHLELGPLVGRLPGDQGFPAWVGALLGAKRDLVPTDYEAGARAGLGRALATGTTTIGDIDSTGAVAAVAGRGGPRVRLYRELLDAWDPARTPAALQRVARAMGEGRRLREGYSPHAPFTVSADLLAGLAARWRRRPRPLAMHWSETEEELAWMTAGEGGFAAVLGSSPRRTGLDLLEEAGLLGPTTALIHGNLPQPGEAERIAAAGASVVHCPGTHRFFRRPAFPLATYRRARVNLALGTDSLASNEDLDLVREGRLLLTGAPGLDPAEVLVMATEGGAQAVGQGHEVGRLEPGCYADALLLEVPTGELDSSPRGLAERLFAGPTRPLSRRRTLVAGRCPQGSPGNPCDGSLGGVS